MENYKLLETIGQGNFGSVVLVEDKRDNTLYVMKKVRLKGMSQQEKEAALQESQLLSKMAHPCIVGYRESILHDNYLSIVMEYCDGGDLSDVITNAPAHFSEEDILSTFVQLALAIDHIHSMNILHRDLKTGNVFLTRDRRVKLGDFGISKVLTGTKDFAKTAIGTPYYLSPEICEGKMYAKKSDIWSLGCILYELTTLKHAFNGKNLPALVLKILRGMYPPIPPQYSDELRDLISSMLQQDPKKRPSIDQVLKLPFIRKRADAFLQRLHEEELRRVNRRSSDRSISGVSNDNSMRRSASTSSASPTNANAAAAEQRSKSPAIVEDDKGDDSPPPVPDFDHDEHEQDAEHDDEHEHDEAEHAEEQEEEERESSEAIGHEEDDEAQHADDHDHDAAIAEEQKEQHGKRRMTAWLKEVEEVSNQIVGELNQPRDRPPRNAASPAPVAPPQQQAAAAPAVVRSPSTSGARPAAAVSPINSPHAGAGSAPPRKPPLPIEATPGRTRVSNPPRTEAPPRKPKATAIQSPPPPAKGRAPSATPSKGAPAPAQRAAAPPGPAKKPNVKNASSVVAAKETEEEKRKKEEYRKEREREKIAAKEAALQRIRDLKKGVKGAKSRISGQKYNDGFGYTSDVDDDVIVVPIEKHEAAPAREEAPRRTGEVIVVDVSDRDSVSGASVRSRTPHGGARTPSVSGAKPAAPAPTAKTPGRSPPSNPQHNRSPSQEARKPVSRTNSQSQLPAKANPVPDKKGSVPDVKDFLKDARKKLRDSDSPRSELQIEMHVPNDYHDEEANEREVAKNKANAVAAQMERTSDRLASSTFVAPVSSVVKRAKDSMLGSVASRNGAAQSVIPQELANELSHLSLDLQDHDGDHSGDDEDQYEDEYAPAVGGDEESDDKTARLSLQIETTRKLCEDVLGADLFLKVYKTLRSVQKNTDDSEIESKIADILSPEQRPILLHVHRLLICEDLFYGQME